MKLKTTLLGKTYQFRDLKQVLAKANEEKSGDKLALLAAESAQERVAAKVVLAGVTLEELREHPAVPYETDEVTRIIQDDLNLPEYEKIKLWTVSELREWILDENTTGADIRRRSRGLTAEMAAAVCKLMSNLDLIYAARKITVTAHCNTTIGLSGTLSCRLQPNHTTDDPEGITASVPVWRYGKLMGADDEKILRAVCLSDLITIHQKTGIGRLSAYCGAVSAGVGAGCGIAWLRGADYDAISHTLENAVAMISGCICDGAKASCASKIAMGVECGMLGYNMYLGGNNFQPGHGIMGKDVEDTIRHVGVLAAQGMRETDRVILRIMTE